jgi:diguanylate cyclase (GGDEF)-like protein
MNLSGPDPKITVVSMFEKLGYPRSVLFPRVAVSAVWGLYLLVFALFHNSAGLDIAALAIFPIIGAGWYFGFRSGVAVAALTILANTGLRLLDDRVSLEAIVSPGFLFVNLALLFTGAVIGRLGTVARERRAALAQLQELERERESQTRFVSKLNELTWAALEVKEGDETLKLLVRQIGELFGAEECLLAVWDEANQSPVPTFAHGSAGDAYPAVRFEPGERSLAAWILETGHPLAISDFSSSSYQEVSSPKMVEFLRNRSLLGLPLATRDRKLGIMYLVYPKVHRFDEQDTAHGELAARQLAMALTRIQSFQDAERRVEEMAVLHQIALAPTQVENVDQLLELATGIIGRNLFPDNFGILLLNERTGLLYPHASYRVYVTEDYDPHQIVVPLGEGVCGQVAQDGKPRRTGDVRELENYLNVDARTRSELCVPLKVRERTLGVINAESTELNAFTAYDENLMITLAGQLATALEYLRSLEAERQWMKTLAHSNELISALSHVTARIERAVGPAGVLKTIREEFQKMGLTCLLGLYVPESDQVVMQYASLLPDGGGTGSDTPDYRLRAEKMETLFGIENILGPMVLPAPLEAIGIILGDLPKDIVVRTLTSLGVTAETEIVHLPLLFEDRLLGALWLWGNDLTRADLPVMSIFAGQMAVTLENARLFEEVQNLAITDPLTGLHNRRGLFEVGKIEFARSRRAGRAFSAVMVDIDHFKKINDTHGHFTGDRVLQKFAQACKCAIRDIDLIGRYGGEEIVILLPETDLQAAREVAERLRRVISDAPLQIADDLQVNVTASLGAAQQDENTATLETLIARADQAMYIAKHKGRNQVATSS